MKIVKFCAAIGVICLTIPTAFAQNADYNGATQPQRLSDVVIQDFSGPITFENSISMIIIEDFTGHIIVNVDGTQTSANLQSANAETPVELSQNGSTIYFSGEERPRNFDVSREIGWKRYSDDAFKEYLADYPTLTITAPVGTALKLDDAITIAAIGDLNGELEIEGGFVDVDAGDMWSADVGVHGPGNIILGHVQDTLTASIHGSGDITIKEAGQSKLSVHGSGNANIGAISGDAILNVHGSGDINTGLIDGAIRASIHGSGDIHTGTVSQSGELSIHGSGDISLDTINGPAKADIFGSGNITISSGLAQSLRVSINGSGDFDFGGISTNLVANLRGSGGIDIAQNEGTIRTSGRGDIRVGGIQINDDN